MKEHWKQINKTKEDWFSKLAVALKRERERWWENKTEKKKFGFDNKNYLRLPN